MQIIYATYKHLECGSSLQMLSLAKATASRGCTVHLIVPQSWPERVLGSLQNSVCCHKFDDSKPDMDNVLARLCSVITREETIVHTQKSEVLRCALATDWIRQARITIIAEQSVAFGPFSSEKNLFICPEVSVIVAVSNAVKRGLLSVLGPYAPRIKVIYPSVDVSHFGSVPRPSPEPNRLQNVGIIANHYELKRIDIALGSLALLKNDHPVRFVFVGKLKGDRAIDLVGHFRSSLTYFGVSVGYGA